jgi:hypothetical protein
MAAKRTCRHTAVRAGFDLRLAAHVLAAMEQAWPLGPRGDGRQSRAEARSGALLRRMATNEETKFDRCVGADEPKPDRTSQGSLSWNLAAGSVFQRPGRCYCVKNPCWTSTGLDHQT